MAHFQTNKWQELRKKYIQICRNSKLLKHETNVLQSDIKYFNLIILIYLLNTILEEYLPQRGMVL